LEHDLFGKSASTFPDHALSGATRLGGKFSWSAAAFRGAFVVTIAWRVGRQTGAQNRPRFGTARRLA